MRSITLFLRPAALVFNFIVDERRPE